MIKLCSLCKKEYEASDQAKRSVCPKCSKTQNQVAIGCGGLILLIAIIVIAGAIKSGYPEKDNAYNAKSYARLYVAKQMRVIESSETKVSYIAKDSDTWTVSGIATGDNMLGGRSNHDFVVKLSHSDTKPYWVVKDCDIGIPY